MHLKRHFDTISTTIWVRCTYPGMLQSSKIPIAIGIVEIWLRVKLRYSVPKYYMM